VPPRLIAGDEISTKMKAMRECASSGAWFLMTNLLKILDVSAVVGPCEMLSKKDDAFY
jgi:hypothetical protein